MAAVPPLPWHEDRRRRRLRRYGAPFSHPRTPGERGNEGEFVPGLSVARELPYKAADGGAIVGPIGARGDGPRKHQNARDKAKEEKGDEARSPV